VRRGSAPANAERSRPLRVIVARGDRLEEAAHVWGWDFGDQRRQLEEDILDVSDGHVARSRARTQGRRRSPNAVRAADRARW
jgi:hypothetical protein